MIEVRLNYLLILSMENYIYKIIVTARGHQNYAAKKMRKNIIKHVRQLVNKNIIFWTL